MTKNIPEDRLDTVAKRSEAAKAKGAAANAKTSPKPVATKPKEDRIVKNGVRLPKAGSKGATAWAIADKVRKANPKADYKELRKLIIPAGERAGEKKSQMSAEVSSWAKYHCLR